MESLISQLNAALAEEWLAYYQYWVGALVVEGAMRADVQSEFEEHAEEERKHAQLLANRIIELEGVPVLDPKKWFELARCKYDAPQEFDSISLLKDNVASGTLCNPSLSGDCRLYQWKRFHYLRHRKTYSCRRGGT